MASIQPLTFPQLLRRFRRTAGLTQEELAERAGLSVEGISALERGVNRSPRRDTVDLLAQALQLSPQERALFAAAARGHLSQAAQPSLQGGDLLSGGAAWGVMSSRSPALATAGAQQSEAISPAAFPPLKALVAHPHNLLVQPSPLVGREREVRAVCALLRRDDVRLVTLIGPGGVGKTRLGLQVAAELLESFPDGVWFVGLSRLVDPALVLPTIARVFDLKESGSTPLAEVLSGYLRDKQLLLLLDNFEQIVAATPSLGLLLAACPGVKALATSRVPLRLRGEHEYPLAPLALPDPTHLPPPEHLSEFAAVALFVERAQAVRPDFAVTSATAPDVTAICARLDGLPLAIELAATKIKLLPPPALLKRLERCLPLLIGGARDLDERQQTMRATLAWSYDLLSPGEQRLFRRLAVFVGGCTLEAAEAVCAAPQRAELLGVDVLEGLSTLVDQSLVQQREEGGEACFVMLHVVREYALEQLQAVEATAGCSEDEALQWAHAIYYLRLVVEAEPSLRGREAHTWLARLDPELDNLRAALGWARDHRELELSLRATRSLSELLLEWGNVREAWHWLEELLTLALPEGPSDGAVTAAICAGLPGSVLAKALDDAGAAAELVGEHSKTERLWEQSLALCRSLGDRAGEGQVLFDLAVAADHRSDYTRAVTLYEDSLALLQEAGDPWWISNVLASFAGLLCMLGDLDRADELLEEALPLARGLDNPIRLSLVLDNLGDVACEKGEWARSLALGREALALARGVGKNHYVAAALASIGLAMGAQALSEHAVPVQERAVRLLAAAVVIRERIGLPETFITDPSTFNRGLAWLRIGLGEATFAAAWEVGRALSLDEAVAEALSEERG